MSESTKERLAKLIIAAERKHEETDEQDRLLDIADALLAAGVTLPEPEPEWRAVPVGNAWNDWRAEKRCGAVWAVFVTFHGPTAEADAREYVARKNARPLDVEAVAGAAHDAYFGEITPCIPWSNVRTEERDRWTRAVRCVLELAGHAAPTKLPEREELAKKPATTAKERAVIEAAREWVRVRCDSSTTELAIAVHELNAERSK